MLNVKNKKQKYIKIVKKKNYYNNAFSLLRTVLEIFCFIQNEIITFFLFFF